MARKPAQAKRKAGERIGNRFELARTIGIGGMGEVWEAEDTRDGGRVAVKVLTAGADADVRARFRREARIVQSLAHPNIARAMSYGQDAGHDYLVLELLRGQDLEQRLGSETAISRSELISIGRQVAAALEAAHAHGVIHRDIKPSNVFLVEGDGGPTVKLLDFGVSRVATPNQSMLTMSGIVIGSPNYMSPEQVNGQSRYVDARSDIFSFATVLYECLTGRRPFEGESMSMTFFKVCYHWPAPPSTLGALANARVDDLLFWGLRKEPFSRPESVRAFWDPMEQALADGDEGPAKLERPGTQPGWSGPAEKSRPRIEVDALDDVETAVSVNVDRRLRIGRAQAAGAGEDSEKRALDVHREVRARAEALATLVVDDPSRAQAVGQPIRNQLERMIDRLAEELGEREAVSAVAKATEEATGALGECEIALAVARDSNHDSEETAALSARREELLARLTGHRRALILAIEGQRGLGGERLFAKLDELADELRRTISTALRGG